MTVDAAIVIVLLQTRIDVRDLKEMPPDTDRWSRATRRAPGRVSCGATAVATAMKVERHGRALILS